MTEIRQAPFQYEIEMLATAIEETETEFSLNTFILARELLFTNWFAQGSWRSRLPNQTRHSSDSKKIRQ